MTPEIPAVEVESEQVYVVYHAKTGAIAHVHRIVTHRGAPRVPEAEGTARALEMAARFGHRRETVRVLRVERFDVGVPQRVDVRTLECVAVAMKPAATRRPAPRSTRKGGSRAPRRAR